ncbi:unnamed protein product [Acanthoscelides obtectus]|uniref:Uncharacterized protein n=1 Tax=Acanthoscelides obtectus TaxID=200917 RepID=A0A9P0PAS7_ACAOB|nr:unnamed protein product [Acanthoscelides obtectus]CAK1651941.1 hypothetical protein AOBTE_LOCUS17563 [Acanthoscelides obtectus]
MIFLRISIDLPYPRGITTSNALTLASPEEYKPAASAGANVGGLPGFNRLPTTFTTTGTGGHRIAPVAGAGAYTALQNSVYGSDWPYSTTPVDTYGGTTGLAATHRNRPVSAAASLSASKLAMDSF